MYERRNENDLRRKNSPRAQGKVHHRRISSSSKHDHFGGTQRKKNAWLADANQSEEISIKEKGTKLTGRKKEL